MNVSYKAFIITMSVLICISLFGGYCIGTSYSNRTIERLETNILELSKRNDDLSARINDLIAGAESSAATSSALAEGLGGLSTGLSEQIRRAQAITNRAQRIAELARILDKGITELIEKIQLVEEGLVGSSDSSND